MKEKYFTRFSVSQRIQHVILLGSFFVLAFTGVGLKFHDFAVSQWWIGLWGGIEVTRLIHRFAAIAFTGVFLFHIIYLAWKSVTLKIFINKKPQITKIFPIFPTIKDGKDLFNSYLYFLGFIKQSPRFGRFDFMQKIEYWAGAWGFMLMIVTGLINWYPTNVGGFLPGSVIPFVEQFPGWVIPLAKMLHGWEAVLAIVYLVIVHFYSAIWSPRVFPLDTTIWTGKISEERMRDEHPLELEDLTGTKEED